MKTGGYRSMLLAGCILAAPLWGAPSGPPALPPPPPGLPKGQAVLASTNAPAFVPRTNLLRVPTTNVFPNFPAPKPAFVIPGGTNRMILNRLTNGMVAGGLPRRAFAPGRPYGGPQPLLGPRVELNAAAPAVYPGLNVSKVLAWDSIVKEYLARAGETNAHFTFGVTNISDADVVINVVRTSCGCTIAKVPSLPWRLPPGADGKVEVAMDLSGKRGTVTKLVSIDTSHGMQLVNVKAIIPEGPSNMRAQNMLIAQANRQAVFRSDCATCHVYPGLGKKGEDLFRSVCGVCHLAEHRASMVADLMHLDKPTDRDYWAAWITKGRPGSLMPAFARSEGGPLDEEQVQSLVDFLTHHFPPRLSFDQAPTPFHDD